MALLLVTDDASPYDAYRLDLRNDGGQEIWRSERLRRQVGGDFSLLLPANLLTPEPLTLQLSGKRNGDWRPIGVYRIRSADHDGR